MGLCMPQREGGSHRAAFTGQLSPSTLGPRGQRQCGLVTRVFIHSAISQAFLSIIGGYMCSGIYMVAHMCGCLRTILRSSLLSTSMQLPEIIHKLVWQMSLSPAPSCQPDMNLSMGQRLYTPGSRPCFRHLCKWLPLSEPSQSLNNK